MPGKHLGNLCPFVVGGRIIKSSQQDFAVEIEDCSAVCVTTRDGNTTSRGTFQSFLGQRLATTMGKGRLAFVSRSIGSLEWFTALYNNLRAIDSFAPPETEGRASVDVSSS